MSEKRQMNGSPARLGRLVGTWSYRALAFVILMAATYLLSPGSPLRAGPTEVGGIIDTDITCLNFLAALL